MRFLASQRPKVSAVEDTLRRPQDPSEGSAGTYPLCAAARLGHTEIVKLLLEAEAQLESVDQQLGSGKVAFHRFLFLVGFRGATCSVPGYARHP